MIAIDVDIAIQAGIENPPREIGLYETKRLRDTLDGWLKMKTRRNLPAAVLLSTPVMAIEAWIMAAMFPRERTPEQIADPASWLVTKKKLRRGRDGKPWKELHRYQDFAPRVAMKLKRVRQRCLEAERTLHLVEQRRDQLHAE